MNLRQLSYFLKMADLQGFTQAANALYISQPALSKQIRQLEEELGTPLFIRSDRGVKLTEAGELLRRRAPAVLEEIACLRNDLQNSYASDPCGPLAVGMGLSVRNLVTLPVVSSYLQCHPAVSLRVIEGTTGPLVDDVKLGALDCALAFTVDSLEPVSTEPYVREVLMVAGAPGCGLSPDVAIALDDAFQRPLALTAGNSPLRKMLEQHAASRAVAIHLALETNAAAVMIDCVRAGTLYAILPYSALHAALNEGQISAAPIQGLSIDWSFVYSRSFGLSLAASAFRSLLFERAQALVASGQWRFAKTLKQETDRHEAHQL